MICDNCGYTAFHNDHVDRTFTINGRVILVEGVPAEVCNRCGDTCFSAEVAERLRLLIHQSPPSTRRIQAEVLRFDAA